MRAAVFALAVTGLAAVQGTHTISIPCPGTMTALTSPPQLCPYNLPLAAPASNVQTPCDPGWKYYDDADRSEGKQSCFQEFGETIFETSGRNFGWSWAAANAYCRAQRSDAHLITIRSSGGYTQGGSNFLSQMLDSLTILPYGYAGCSQRALSPIGDGKTSTGWSWLDGTSNNNLVCPNPSSGSCGKGKNLWLQDPFGQAPL